MRNRILIPSVLCCLAVAWPGSARGQATGFRVAQAPSAGATVPGTTGIAPITPAPPSSPPATLQTPSFGGSTFDPYAGNAAQPPTLYGQQALPTQPIPGYGATPPTDPSHGAYPHYPSTAFPDGMFVDPHTGMPYQWAPPLKLFQNLRLRYTWVYDDESSSGDTLQIMDFDINTTVAIPNFLWSGQPLMLTPAFSLHLWDGPTPPSAADLPSKAYSAYLDVGWTSNPAHFFGVVLAGRVGVFSDFDTVTSDSVRAEGLGLLTYRISHTCMIKGGIVYLDRNRIKMMPAGGLLWTPNPQTRFDVFFPKPKLAQFLTTLGTTDVWWYVAAEYGGGNWTVVRDSGFRDSVDINDIRVMLGVEWMREQRQVAAIEVGWVTDRELIYRLEPADNIRMDDTFMLRAELTF